MMNKEDLEKKYASQMQEMQGLVDAINAGRITPKQFFDIQQRKTIEQNTPKLMEYRERGQWQDFIDLALCVWQLLPFAFRFYNEIPDSMKYNFAISAYTHHGDQIGAVRKAVRSAGRYGKATLPEELTDAKTVEIYRAGEEPIEKAKFRISWTTDLKIANFFLNEYTWRHATHLYKGTIRTQDIIAYTDEREEREVMQYGKVFDIIELPAPEQTD